MEENIAPAEKNEPREKIIQVRLKWGSDAALETTYINQVKITHIGSEFYLLFGELVMPIVLEDEQFPDELTITPKARMAVTPEQMIEISKVIESNCQKYLEKKNGHSDNAAAD